MKKETVIHSVEDTIIHYVFDAIFSNKLYPGLKLSESVFAQDFNVSRDLIRKAFSQLQSMGILTYKKNKGFTVKWLSQKETKDVYTARNVLEVGIITHITQQNAVGAIDLSSLNEDIETEEYLKVTLQNGEYVKTSCDFHLNLALLSKNDFLINALKPLIPLSILAGLSYQDSTTSFCSYEEHRSLIKAIKSNDVEYAKSIMNNHLHNCVDALDFDKPVKKDSFVGEM